MRSYFCPQALVAGSVVSDVLIGVEAGRITSVRPGSPPATGAKRLDGLVIPGLANTHSHAFQRALRGRTHRESGDFWSWRDLMYSVAERLEPEGYFALARAVYGEMALAGITAVGEFHYLHHQAGGASYDPPNAMGEALVQAATEAGIRITLLDTCYLRAGFGQPPSGLQRRFSDGSASAWAERVDGLRGSDIVNIGAAIHSVRAVDEASAGEVAGWAERRGAPLHFHLSEQRAENETCLAATGRTPTRLLADAGAVSVASTAVHATHVNGADIAILGSARVFACLCPTTERDLGDGIGPASALAVAGSRLTLGSDSHAVVDLFEEARLLELHQRLGHLRRGHHTGQALLAAATGEGMQSLGWDAGAIAAGKLADFVAVDMDSVRTAGAGGDLDAVVFAATAADVTDVVVAGERVVSDRAHVRIEDVGQALNDAILGLLD